MHDSDRRFGAALALLLFGAALVACSGLPRSLAPPRVELESLELVQATSEFQRFAVTLRLDNLNAFDVPVERVEFSARLSGQGVLIGESAAPVTLPALDTATLRVEVSTELVSSLASMLAVVEGPDDAIPYELNGVIQLASGMDRRIRFSYSGRVPLRSTAGASR